jgi:hypothetical protein
LRGKEFRSNFRRPVALVGISYGEEDLSTGIDNSKRYAVTQGLSCPAPFSRKAISGRILT